MMPGFVERLKEDLDKASSRVGASLLASVIPHPTIHEPGYNSQRKHAPWIGGSMLASLSPFKQASGSARMHSTARLRFCTTKL